MKMWMIYGANGFLGQLIVAEAVRRGYQPILAGRNDKALMLLADTYDLEYRVFDLQHQKIIKDQLHDVVLLLNCAGPFMQTADALRTAAIAKGCHYLDVSAETAVNQQSLACDNQAIESGSVILPALGFYSVVADVLVHRLLEQHAEISRVKLIYTGQPFYSRGMQKTLFFLFLQGTVNAKKLPYALLQADKGMCMYSSGLNEISLYQESCHSVFRKYRWMGILKPILKTALIQRFIENQMDKRRENKCSDTLTRNIQITAQGYIAGDNSGRLEHKMEVAESFSFSVFSTLMAVEHVLADKLMPGAYSPSQALDIDAVLAMDIHHQHSQDRAQILDINSDFLE
ncbi:MAG: saccharopine dehydrogenase NADP-binding domain-containing protein [Pseudomonadales bacterium]|nr:saccharopine dehydrogenase NADP-binding domain-containing protein [Pseudomonadales bacterium]